MFIDPMSKPIAITMGCPAGIGPEIILQSFDQGQFDDQCRPVVIGDCGVLSRAAKLVHSQHTPVAWEPGTLIEPGTIPVLEISESTLSHVQWGHPSQESSLAMAQYIRVAVKGCLNHDFSAMVTCPLSKKSLHDAGIDFPGHTEMLAQLTGATQYRMMMAGRRLRVVLVTIHEPLAAVSKLITAGEVEDCIAMTVQSLQRDFGLPYPRVAVAGLNPHSGEQGLFGRKELDVLTPVVQGYKGRADVSGPWPPDTVFHKAAAGSFDAVVAMYHDQGLIPFKLLHFQDGVNVTLGLPIVRTSVDHGTAYDIAGKGIADPASLLAAISLAREIAVNRKKGAVNNG